MSNVPGDCVLTYDPNCTEYHSDSSDFEGPNTPVTHKEGSHSLLMKKLYSKSKRNLNLQTCGSRTDNTSKEMWESQTMVTRNGRAIDLEVQQTYRNRKCKTLDSGDQIETIKSKRSLIRHKVIPCLSSMFGRTSNNVKQMSIIKENQAENTNTDNGCQVTRVNCEHRMRKFNRRQPCYAVQPVYTIEGNVHAKSTPFQYTKNPREPLPTCKTFGNENCVNYSLTSSSEANERQIIKRKKGKCSKCNKSKYPVEPEREIGRHYYKHYEGPDLKHREQQCSSNFGQKCPYHVYTNPYQYPQTSAGCSPMGSNRMSNSELPATCSGFWEYLFNKINMKYQAQAAASMFKPCKCNTSIDESPRCCPAACENLTQQSFSPQTPQTAYCQQMPYKPEPCSCSTSPQRGSPLNINDKIQPRPSPVVPPFKVKPDKIECKCFQPKKPPSPLPQPTPPSPMQVPPPPPPRPPEPPRPCQLGHQEITASLKQKYNGEILCIHNPPCVLINGCLNLPPPKEELTMDLWPVTQSNKSAYQPQEYKHCERKQQSAQYCLPSIEIQPNQIMDVSCQYFPPAKEKQSLKTKMNESCQYQLPYDLRELITDEGCQYKLSACDIRKPRATTNEGCQYWPSPSELPKHVTTSESCQELIPIIEVKQIKTPHPKKEKIIQSICNHNPPCEVVRTCCKTRFDPKLQNSCVHVPMCEKVPLCLMELKSQNRAVSSCQHKPKCAEVPICTRNYIVLTAKEEVATQVRPKAKMVCRHEPPCIMIPSCLAKVCDSYIPFDAIPDCIHQPMCEMIPACCRKSAKAMVSVHSQYPNQCCIV